MSLNSTASFSSKHSTSSNTAHRIIVHAAVTALQFRG